MVKILSANKISDLPDIISSMIKEKGNVYFTKNAFDYCSSNRSIVLYLYNDNYIVPFSYSITKLIWKIGSFLSEPLQISNISNESLNSFLNSACEFVRKNIKIHFITITPAYTLFSSYPNKSKRIRFGNYVINLQTDEAIIWNNIDSKHKNMIRRGEKEDIVVKYGSLELLDDYVLLDEITWQRSRKKVNNYNYYKKIVNFYKENVLIGIAYKNNVPQSGLIGLYNNAMFYYMFGASSNKPTPGSTHFLQWCTIKKMKELNIKFYNFVGCRINADKNSKFEHIQHFKKGFGGELIQCFLFKTVFNDFKYFLYKIIYFLKTSHKLNDAIDQEIYKWKEINK